MRLAAVGGNCMDVYDAVGAYPDTANVAVYFVRLGGMASYIRQLVQINAEN